MTDEVFAVQFNLFYFELELVTLQHKRIILAKIQPKLTFYLQLLKCSIYEKNTIQSEVELKIIFDVKGMNHG